MTQIDLALIEEAAQRIKGIACYTPLKRSINLSQRVDKDIFLKMETMQDTGAFKLRGAANVILSLSEQQREAGVVTASSGNHGRAVAYVAAQLGIKVIVCVTTLVPANKIEAIEQLGAQVVVHGDNQDLTTLKAQEIAVTEQMHFVSAFDDPQVIAGQGTIALEILQQQPGVDTIVTQLSGGGLASGIAIAAKALKPSINIIGVTLSHGAAMLESIKAGKLVEVDETPSVADALTGPIPPDNQYTFPICRDLLDDIVQVTETQIMEAMVYCHKREKIILEGGAAATVAYLLAQGDQLAGNNIAVVCSGDNVDVDKLIGYAKLL